MNDPTIIAILILFVAGMGVAVGGWLASKLGW